jgi:membrane-associated phospholipid phosphatase
MNNQPIDLLPITALRYLQRIHTDWVKSAIIVGSATDVIHRTKVINLYIIIINFIIVPLYFLANYRIGYNILLIFPIVFPTAIILLNYYFKNRHSNPIFSHIIMGTTQLYIGAVASIALSYTVMRSNLPLVDSQLDLIDNFIGFDWHSYARYITQSPQKLNWAYYFYGALEFQLLVATFIAVLFLKFREYQIFILSFLISALVTIVLSGIFPAYGTFSYYGIMDQMNEMLLIKSGHDHVAQLETIRAGLPFDPTVELRGIITFPSFHACGGFLLAWLFWQIPYVRIIMVPLNVMMILVTPLLGAHYLSDVIAGILIGALVLTITKYVAAKGLPSR